MIEIRFHGRGGQGAVTAANILANAAFIEGNDVQSFPYFGVERRGAPVTAFTRIDSKPIRIKSQIYKPDYVIVLDEILLQSINVAEGLKDEGILLINTRKKPKEIQIEWKGKITTVDATKIAIKYRLGSKNQPIVNTSILGGFSKATDKIKIESIVQSIKQMAPRKKEENAEAAKEAYENLIR